MDSGRIHRFEINRHGRDFIVGDVHGSYPQLRLSLARARFDPSVDRLFLVGDLIDRGVDSMACIDLLQEPWVYAVRGNHEQMLIDLYAEGEPDLAIFDWVTHQNGLQWWREVPDADRWDIVDQLRALPYVIEVESRRGTVGILHAEVPLHMRWDEFIRRIDAGDERAINSCLWGRDRIKFNVSEYVNGIGRIFSGHTVVDSPTKLGNIYAIDTGAVFSDGHLTLAQLDCRTGVLISPAKPANKVAYSNASSSQPFSK